MKAERKKKERIYPYIILGMAVVFLYYVPYFVLGQDAAFKITDFMDDEVVQYLLNGKYLFASSDTIVEEWLSGAPIATIQAPCYVLIFFFKFLPFYSALLLSSIFGNVFAYIGMFLLCDKLLLGKQRYISFVTAMLFCILPYYPSYGLSSVGIPLVVWACLHLCEKKQEGEQKSAWKEELRYLPYYLILIFYAFSSSLIWSGYFVLFFMALAAGILLIKRKRSGIRIFSSVAVMTGVYCFVFKETLINVLFETFVSHRSDPDKIYVASDFLKEFVSMFKYGQYHAPSLHTYIMAFSLCVLAAGWILYKKLQKNVHKKVWFVTALWLAALFIAAFHAFYNCEAGIIVRSYLGPLESFQLDRIYWTYPTLWYVELAISLSLFFDEGEIVLDMLLRLNGEWKQKILKVARGLFTFAVAVFFVHYITHHICSKEYCDNVKKMCGQESTQMSYRDFYDHELFEEIAQYIGRDRSTYRVGCLGFVPAIATVNGFYTVDGYSTNYPLEYKYKFRTIIEEELEKNEAIKVYYDNWGSRCYLMSAELGQRFQILKAEKAVIHNLEIHTDVLRELGCEYIFSAVEIRNASELGMLLLDVFSREEGAVEIYVYELCPLIDAGLLQEQ